MTRPNILWICTDQQRWDTLGCYGNPHVHTPNLDRLAADGVVFDHCFSQSPVCTPSRVSFLTGRYPRTTRCRQNGQSIPADEVLVTKLLADAQRAAGLSGKLHISACHPKVAPFAERRVNDGYAEFHWSHHPKADWPTNEYFHWLRERGVGYERHPFSQSRYVETSMAAEHHQTTWCAQQAINLIEAAASKQQPWLFSVNFYDPHHPFDPPLEYLQPYLDRLHDVPLPRYTQGELDNKPIFQRIDHGAAYNTPREYPFPAMMERDHRLVRAAYWAMVDLIDAQVGRLLDVLERTGQRENTLVIFMSDHGEMLGDHGIYLKGPYLYDEAIRVPLIIACPGTIRGARRSPALVELVDLAPTLLEASGLPVYPGMQGRSLWPLLTEHVPETQHRDDVYCEYYNAMPWHTQPKPHATMVRTAHHKLTLFHGLDTGELYDLQHDPQEIANLWNDQAYQTEKGALLARLCDRMAWTVDPLPLREAAW
jgi:choline-sulfatase